MKNNIEATPAWIISRPAHGLYFFDGKMYRRANNHYRIERNYQNAGVVKDALSRYTSSDETSSAWEYAPVPASVLDSLIAHNQAPHAFAQNIAAVRAHLQPYPSAKKTMLVFAHAVGIMAYQTALTALQKHSADALRELKDGTQIVLIQTQFWALCLERAGRNFYLTIRYTIENAPSSRVKPVLLDIPSMLSVIARNESATIQEGVAAHVEAYFQSVINCTILCL